MSELDPTAAAAATDPTEGLTKTAEPSAPSTEFVLNDRFETSEEQAGAWEELNGKFGGFTGSPTDGYEVNLPEGSMVELDVENEGFKEFLEVCQEANMNQATFNKLLGFYATDLEADYVSMDDVKAELGDNVEMRITNIEKATVDMGLSEATCDTIDKLSGTAEGFRAIEEILGLNGAKEPSMTRNDNGSVQNGLSRDEIEAEQANPLYRLPTAEGKAHRAKVDGLWKSFFGEK